MTITAGIAALLAVGFLGGKLCRLLHLPTVTGYILAGLLLGPTGFALITEQSAGHGLDHFSQIALMLITFGIGEHIELAELKGRAKSLFTIGVCEVFAAFLLIALTAYLALVCIGIPGQAGSGRDFLTIALLLGSVGVATAPAATLMVVREQRAKGPMTQTLMALVALDSAFAITLFGIVVSLTQHLLVADGGSLSLQILRSLVEIFFSLVLGGVVGGLLYILVNRLHESGEIMTAGLAILLLMGEIAVFLHLSSLLAGMTAGCVLVNTASRDVRMFRELNKFEPPIYVMFFTLAGVHLDLHSLQTAGIVGLIYFLARIIGKIAGVFLGARLSRAIPEIGRNLGLALLPQAGVAIGLIFLLSSNPVLARYTDIITPVVLAAVFLSELIGPIGTRFAITRAGESTVQRIKETAAEVREKEYRLIPWRWGKLEPPRRPRGVVAFHGDNPVTARGLARVATIFANYYRALPMAVEVVDSQKQLPSQLFAAEHDEVHRMGYSLMTELVTGEYPQEGLARVVADNETSLLVLSFPLEVHRAEFISLLRTLNRTLACPLAVVRFYGEFHTERILIPVCSLDEIAFLYEIICGLAAVGDHKLTLLLLIPPNTDEAELGQQRRDVEEWLSQRPDGPEVVVKMAPSESRLIEIEKESEEADLLVMAADFSGSLKRFLFGSLVASVASKIRKSLIVVYGADKVQENGDEASP